MSPETRHQLAVAVIVVTAAITWSLSLSDGHDWGDDFAQYIMQAASVAEGRSMPETSYVYNPHDPEVGPSSYPPLYPLSLAPVYGHFGLDFKALKFSNVVFLSLFLICLAVLLRQQGWEPSLALLVLVGFNPVLRVFADNIVSDSLFLLARYGERVRF